MMKRIAGIFLVFILMISMFSVTAFAQKLVKVVIDGKTVTFETSPYIENGRVMVPVDTIAAELDSKVVYDTKTNTVWLEKEYMSLEIPVGKSTLYVHRKYDFSGIPQEVKMDVATKSVKGKVFVPVRFIAESMEMIVTWDQNKFTVVIEKNDAVLPVETPIPFTELSSSDLKGNTKLAKWCESNYKTAGIHFITDKGITYVLISAGEKPTGGYSVKVEGVTMVSPGNAYISARIIEPAPDTMVTEALTYPHALIKLDAKNIKDVQGDIQAPQGSIDEKQLEYTVVNPEDIKNNERLYQWYESNSHTKGFHYIRDNNFVYVLAAAGQKPTGGYRVEIEQITQPKPDSAYVYARLLTPAPDMMVTQAITYPHILVRIDSDIIKDVTGELIEMVAKKTLEEIGVSIAAKDVKSIELFNFEQESIKKYNEKEVEALVREYNGSMLDDSPFIEMITGNSIFITMKNGMTIRMISYGSKTNFVASGQVNGEYFTYHLVNPEIAKILLEGNK